MLALSTLFSLSALLAPAFAQTPFVWKETALGLDVLQLTPDQNLTWVPCYSTFQCARLQVPLDYADPSAGTAALAVIRLPANVSSDDAAYRGPILFNPGGPGASGVDTLVLTGASFQVLFGAEYDIVSFDPRGVSYSTPTASFFQTDAERALWNAGAFPTSLNASADALPRAWGRGALLGQLAAARDSDPSILKYMTTDNVARDMLRITQKSGFERVKYYGISYGSILGATFAAMFPDKVERILIDGVLDADAWFNSNLTIEATATDAVLSTFFTSCAAAGPTLCAFHAPTPALIAARLSALEAAVRARPVPAFLPSTGAYGLMDYSALRSVLFTSLYVPYILFPPLAAGLAALEAGDASVLFSLTQTAPPFQCRSGSGSAGDGDGGEGGDPNGFHLNNAEAVWGVQCGDGVQVRDSVGELREFYERAAKVSGFAEFLVGGGRVGCAGWKVHREGRFLGPVAAANTSFPLLLLTTSADPVAPKEAALKTLAGFPGSALLVQDSPGHASITAPSACTASYFRAYFRDGALPAPGTIFQAQSPPSSSQATSATATRTTATSQGTTKRGGGDGQEGDEAGYWKRCALSGRL
ncbi:hypothetical protein C8R46DRAFT_1286950 [Mycena filopes]|nr:hypothetical protein C8R46DRAFT_1286950 [Mycena filopes]